MNTNELRLLIAKLERKLDTYKYYGLHDEADLVEYQLVNLYNLLGNE